jgi:hypothetical protein
MQSQLHWYDVEKYYLYLSLNLLPALSRKAVLTEGSQNTHFGSDLLYTWLLKINCRK